MKRRGPPRRRRRARPGLAEAREVVARRAGGRCEAAIAGTCWGRGDQAHHICRRSQGGADTPENLAWVCTPCHDWIHGHPADARARGLLASGHQPIA